MNYEEFLQDLNREAYHEGEWQWQEGDFTVTRTTHWSPPGCHNGCGVLLFVKDGKLVKVEGDPLNPVNNGKLCMRCLAMPEAVNHPDRLKYPMRRAGERGENKWERITWDEAYDEIEAKVKAIKAEYGSTSILCSHGTGRNIGWQVPYFASAALETPNVSCFGFTGFACYLPRMIGASAKFGDMCLVDASQCHEERYLAKDWEVPGVVLVWGNEPIKSNADAFLGHWLVECVQLGTKIISIDPRLTWWGTRAEYWFPVRPGTDAVLAMALLHIIIVEDLYDHEFVDSWTYGFDMLAERIADKTPEWAAEICQVNADDIRGAARLIASASSCAVQWGLAFEQQIAALGVTETVSDIMAVTGNIDNPGGNILTRCAFMTERRYGLGDELMTQETRDKKLTWSVGINESEIVKCADSDAILRAIETGDPYPIKMMWIQSSNNLACTAMDSPRIFAALKTLDFICVADPFMTPTAIALADIVLPVAMSCERNSVRSWWTPVRSIVKACDRYYEAKSDEDIVLELGKRLVPENWPWANDEEFSTWYLQDELVGTLYEKDFRQLVEQGGWEYWDWDATYKKYEKGMLRPDGAVGFNTPTGRVELWSYAFDHWGVDPLPFHIEPPESPISTPKTFEKFPLILSGGGRSFEFFHSEHRQLPTMREFHPWPLIMVHPDDAAKYGITDGQWIWVENSRGARFKQKTLVTKQTKPGVVHAEHAWWFPETEGAEPNLFGVFDSNLNNLTEAYHTGQGGIGSAIKSMLCKIYPFEEGDMLPSEQVTRHGGFTPVTLGERYPHNEE